MQLKLNCDNFYDSVLYGTTIIHKESFMHLFLCRNDDRRRLYEWINSCIEIIIAHLNVFEKKTQTEILSLLSVRCDGL